MLYFISTIMFTHGMECIAVIIDVKTRQPLNINTRRNNILVKAQG